MQADTRLAPVARALPAALLAAALLLPLVVDAAAVEGRPICLFKAVTALPCPLCGLTRSWLSAGRWQWARSAAFHPIGPAVYVGAVASLPLAVASAAGWRRCAIRWPAWMAWGAVASVLIVWMVRLAAAVSSPAPPDTFP